LILHKTTVHF